MNALKKEFLELLDKDIEFRYAIAGYLGLSEILKRLDSLSEEQVNLRKEQIKLREEQISIGKEQAELRKEQIKLREDMIKGFARHDEEIRKLREDMIIGFKKHDEELAKLREDFNKMFNIVNIRLNRVERTLEKLTVDIEDEAKSIIKYRIKEELGIDIEITPLILPELELNIYGISNDICVVGEATVRAGAKLVDELLEKFEKLKTNYPNLLRRKVIFVIYVSLPLIELIEKAKEKNIWLLKATEEFFRPKKIFYEI